MRLLVITLFVLTLLSCAEKKTPADTIISGGFIYTMNDSQPTVEAVAVSGTKIIFAGSTNEAMEYKGDNTQLIDLQGKTMTPGLIEGHGHMIELGYSELSLNLSNVKSYEELVSSVKDAVAKAQPGQWIIGFGWHQDKWTTKPSKTVKGFQTHQQLSAVSPDNPVFLSHASGHAIFANAKAMQIAGINNISKEQLRKDLGEGGEIIRDELGNPTGIFNENALQLIAQHIPANTEESDAQALTLAMDACARNGITSFHDAGVSQKAVDLFHKFKSEGKMKSRLYVMLSGGDRPLVYQWLKKGPEIDSTAWLTIRSIKLYGDGALGSRGAWLLEPYTDRPDFSGMATQPMDTVLKTSQEALKYGFQVCTHAIGDRANREILDRYETAFKENPDKAKDARFRIEHAQHISINDLPRFAKLGVIPSMEAIHLSSDRPWAIERLGEKRIKEGAYMWQTLLKSGAKIVNGTDVPVESINPIACYYASVTRRTLAGDPPGGYEPEEKMTREQALRSYTLDAAYGAFQENIKGSIEQGKLADFTVFSQDIMTVPDDEILKTKIDITIVDGKVVYLRNL